MILALMVLYIVLLHVLFNVLKVVKASTRNKIYVAVFGCFLIYCMLLFINYYQPMSTDLRVVRYVVPLRTRVQGTVAEVLAEPNVALSKGDAIFRIDPRPFEAEVARLEAALAEAEQQARMLPVEFDASEAAVARAEAAVVEARQSAQTLDARLDAAKAGVAKFEAQRLLSQAKYDRDIELVTTDAVSREELEESERNLTAAKASLQQAIAERRAAQLAVDSEIGGVNTVVVKAEEELLAAKAARAKAKLAVESTIDGENTTVARIRAELAAAETDLADTVVMAPADGFVTNLSLRPGQSIVARDTGVVSFVSNEYAIAATFHQQVLDVINPGDEAEIALDDLPGRTLRAVVKNTNWGIPQGQVVSRGRLVDSTPAPHGRFFVQFTLESDEGLRLPAGEAGAATVYTSRGRLFVPVRKVFFRWYTWLNYIITDMDVRGPRQ